MVKKTGQAGAREGVYDASQEAVDSEQDMMNVAKTIYDIIYRAHGDEYDFEYPPFEDARIEGLGASHRAIEAARALALPKSQ
jgi:hypothetical protein